MISCHRGSFAVTSVQRPVAFLCALALAAAGCVDRVSAPEILDYISRWDSVQLRSSADLLAMHWTVGSSFKRLPGAATITVQDGGQPLAYRAVVVENLFRNGSARRACGGSDFLAVIMWRDDDQRAGLDVLITTVGAKDGPMEGSLRKAVTTDPCGLRPEPAAWAYTITDGRVAGLGWQALEGSLRVRRRGRQEPCAFITDAAALAAEGIGCVVRRYDVDLDALMVHADSTRRDRRLVRLNERDIVGAVFTVDCANPARRFNQCG